MNDGFMSLDYKEGRWLTDRQESDDSKTLCKNIPNGDEIVGECVTPFF